MQERYERQAINESLLRDVNECRAALDKNAESAWAAAAELFEFLCECGVPGSCDGRVRMTLAEYERVRSQDDRFAVVPGHETDGLERAVEEHERFVIVDKLAAAEPFVANDPRGAPSR